MDVVGTVDGLLESFENNRDHRRFLLFLSDHPELSFINNCFLYLQDNKAPRYVAHRGICKKRGLPMDHPVALERVKYKEENASLFYDGFVYYPAASDEEHTSLKDCLIRMGYRFEDSTDKEIVIDQKTIHMPTDEEKRQKADWDLTDFFVKDFYQAIQKRGIYPPIDEKDFDDYYIQLLTFMLCAYEGFRPPQIPKIIIDWLQEPTYINIMDESYAAVTIKYFILFTYYMELIQVVEKRHFTMTEAEVYRAVHGTFSSTTKIRGSGIAFLDLYTSFSNFCKRYPDNYLQNINWQAVHIYPTLKF